MAYLEAPNRLDSYPSPSIFLAGGITGVGNWQKDTANALEMLFPNLLVMNPRRENFDVNDPSAAGEQIKWEHHHLMKAEQHLFWFSDETLQPIALFELGKISAHVGKPLHVGVHPLYKRRMDVIIQLRHVRPDVYVYDSLLETVADVQV